MLGHDRFWSLQLRVAFGVFLGELDFGQRHQHLRAGLEVRRLQERLFLGGAVGDIIDSALTNASLGACSMPSQSALRLLALRKSRSATSRASRSTSSSPLRE